MLFITGVRNFMGEEKALAYLQQLAKQDIVSIASANRVVVDRVMAGEHALCLDAFLHHPIISARKGAPVAPLPLDPVLTVVSSVMLPKAPPHPYAAMLFIDYLLSKEGQVQVAGRGLLPGPSRRRRFAGPRQDRAAQDRPEGKLHLAGKDELGSGEVAGTVPGAFRQMTNHAAKVLVRGRRASMAGMTITIARDGGRSSMVRRYSPQVIILIALLCAGVIPPFVFLAYSSLHELDPSGAFGAFTFGHFAAIFSSRTFGSVIVNSAVYSLGSALLALAIGATQAWLAERTDAFLRQVLYVSSIVSLGIPYVLYIVAWILFLGKAGPVNAFLQQMFGGTEPYINVYSLGGMIFVEGMLWSPLAFLLLSPVFRNSDASFEEAASICGAGLFSTLRHVTLGMARPALMALGLLVFIKASESFEVPALVGLPGSARVLTSTIYQRLTLDMPPDVGSASAFGVLLLVVMAVLLQVYSRVAAQTHRYQTVTGKGFRPRVIRLGRWRYAAGALIVTIPFIVVVIPLATILWAALLPYYQPLSLKAVPLLGFGNFVQVLNSPSFRGAIVNSLCSARPRRRWSPRCRPSRAGVSRGAWREAACSMRWRRCRWCFPRSCSASPSWKYSFMPAAGFTAACYRSSSYRSWPICLTDCAMRSSASFKFIPSSKKPPPSPAPGRREPSFALSCRC